MDTSYVVDSTNINTEMPADVAETVEMVEAVEEIFIGNPEKFRELIDDEKPLYKGCPNFTKLSTVIQLLNLKNGDEMYSSTYEAKKASKEMGSGYTKIHACVNNYILYKNEYTDMAACPTCGKSRWKSKTIAKDLTWHATDRKVDIGVLSQPADSPARAAIDDKYPNFASKPRNLRLGISADEVDVNRRKFIMLSLLISDTPINDFDVFLAPFIDDLQLLFDIGVETYDAYAQDGFQGCVVCGEETHCIRLPESNKLSYAGHRRFLPYDHPFRRQKRAFNGQQEFSPSPEPMKWEEVYNKVKFIINKWGKVSKGKEAEIQQSTTGRDFMHVEKNVGESLTGTVLNVPGKKKDGYKGRLDLVHYCLKLELHPKIEGNNTTLPAAGCTLTKEEKDKLCVTLYNLRVPQSKEIKLDELDKLQEELCVTLCLLEKHFPPSFFDVMIHLTVYLTMEVKLCGPIFFRWMYPFERFMKVIKGHVRNKNRLEGCIVEENVAEETIEFFSEFLKKMDIVGIPPENHNTCGIQISVDSSSITDGTPLSAAKSVEVSAELFSKAHFFVLQNTSEVLLYIKDTYEDVDEEFSTLVPQNDNILPRVDTLELQKENDYFRIDFDGILIRTKGKAKP
ncbi:uncharacterized protein LOC111907998 [Lactuca sativa]|uniref:uncharacterized protein LOC111907998 n=1 Tax=Lactuca sativa TaxID=4236 RepID=UPI000CD891EC|nr:uncharacterized protein LOC111907998 [Lactuca sativa]